MNVWESLESLSSVRLRKDDRSQLRRFSFSTDGMKENERADADRVAGLVCVRTFGFVPSHLSRDRHQTSQILVMANLS